MGISLTNSSSHLRREGETDWWNWTAYVHCTPPDSLDAIRYVEYHLHKSFRSPIVRVTQEAGGFPLERTGWGVFEVVAKVVFKDKKRRPLTLKHDLEFEYGKPVKP